MVGVPVMFKLDGVSDGVNALEQSGAGNRYGKAKREEQIPIF
jgi:hypothetical protein